MKFEHVGMSVSNLDKSIKWYEDNLGFELVSRSEKPSLKVYVALMKLGKCMFEMFQHYEPKPSGYNNLEDSLRRTGFGHIGIAVDDVEFIYRTLDSNEVKFERVISEGSTSKYFFCKDPDGNLIEIIQRI